MIRGFGLGPLGSGAKTKPSWALWRRGNHPSQIAEISFCFVAGDVSGSGKMCGILATQR